MLPRSCGGFRARLARDAHTAAFTFLHDLAIVLDAGRRRREDEAVLAVEIRVEDDREGVAVRQRDVADLLTRRDALRLAIVEPGADVERLAIGQDAHLGAFGDRLPLA